MKLTPLEIRKQEFRKAMRGFDPIEVQTFLEMVSEQYEELVEENKRQSRQLIELQTKLENYQNSEKTLRETLLNVQEVKKQSEESSRRQADLILKEAELKALEILENARKQTRKIREEVNWLKSQKESFINRLRHILASQIELLSVMEIDDIIPADSQEVVKNWKSRKHTQPPAGFNPEEDMPELDMILPGEPPQEESETKGPAPAAPEKTEEPKSKSRIIRPLSKNAPEAKPLPKQNKNQAQNETSLTEDDINDFFKKGIQIDDLIKTINKKDFDK